MGNRSSKPTKPSDIEEEKNEQLNLCPEEDVKQKIGVPFEFREIKVIDDPTLCEYMRKEPNITYMYAQ